MPPAFEVLLLNTAVPQIQAAQAGDTYVVPRDIAFSAALTLSAGTANGVPYLNGSKVVTTGSALTFDGTNLTLGGTSFARYTIIQSLSGASAAFAISDNATTTMYANNVSSGVSALWSSGSLAFGTGSGNPFSEQMRLTSTGLGIGTSSPAYKLDVSGTINSGASNATGYNLVFRTSGITTGRAQTSLTNTSGDLYTGIEGSTAGQTLTGSAAYSAFIGTFTANPLYLVTNGVIRTTLDSSGNLGLGVTPSAWGNEFAAMQYGFSGAVASYKAGTTAEFMNVLSNTYNDNTNWRYIRDGAATRYELNEAVHKWFTAPSGTAGNTISFTQAMTLTEAGVLLVGTTSKGTYGANTVELRGANIATPGGNDTGNLSIFTTNSQAANVGAVVALGGVFDGTTPYAFGAIAGRKSNSTAGNAEGYLQFYTTNASNVITERARIKSTGQFRFVPLAADPAGAEAGDVYYNSGTNKLRLYDGTSWVDLN